MLRDILQKDDKISNEFFISKKDILKWNILKVAKKEHRTTSKGFDYYYSEGLWLFLITR